jgi:hypothetical protein
MLLNISFHFDYFPSLVTAAIEWGTLIILSILKLTMVQSVIIEIILGSIDHESFRILDFFALTGFIFLLFPSGLEIDEKQIGLHFHKRSRHM